MIPLARSGVRRLVDDPADPIGGQRVARLGRRADRGAALRGRLLAALDRLRLDRELVILDLVAKPPRVVTVPAVELPGLVVDPVAEVDEQQQVVRLEVELGLRAAEVEAAPV